MIEITDRTVVVDDDGLATGLTDPVAVRALRAHAPKRIVLAVPVASAQAFELTQREADEVMAIKVTATPDGVGRWYRNFGQVSDREVDELLALAQSFAVFPGEDPELTGTEEKAKRSKSI